jgi:ABC-type spermidine/putrescine transport system permease subunit I
MEGTPKSWRDPALLLTAGPIIAVALVLFFAPLGMVTLLSFQSTQYYQLQWTWDLAVWGEVFSKGYFWHVMGRTVVMALLTVVGCLLLSLPVAYAMVTRAKAFDTHVKVLIIFAFLTDSVLKAFGWVLFLDKSGGLNWTLELIGFAPTATNILFTRGATLVGMIYHLLPYTIFTIYLALLRVDRDVILAAYDAGATKIRTFLAVTLPLARTGVLIGAVLVFVLAFGVFLEPEVLGGGKSPMAAELIRQTFETRVNWPLGSALTLVAMAVAALCLAGFGYVALHGRRGTGQ